MRAALVIAAAYVVGSIPFSYLIVRALRQQDIRHLGSGNPGATNVARVAGTGAGVVALALDAGKGVVVVWLAQRAAVAPPVVGAAALAVVVGHLFPVFLQFQGGKGVATGLGVLVGLAPMAAALSALAFLVVVARWGYVSLGSVVGVALSPVLVLLGQRLGWVHPGGLWLPLTVAVIALLVVAKHRDNLKRLRARSESKLGSGGGGGAGP